MSKIFLISGPSGSGQDAISDGLAGVGVKVARVITTTSRPPRSTESEGRPYHFLSRSEFENKLAQNEFLEYAEYGGYYYGVSKSDLDEALASGLPVLWKVDHQGIKNIKKLFPDCVAILVYASPEEIEARLIKRGDNTPEQITERMDICRRVLAEREIYDKQINNRDGHVADAVNELAKIISE